MLDRDRFSLQQPALVEGDRSTTWEELLFEVDAKVRRIARRASLEGATIALSTSSSDSKTPPSVRHQIVCILAIWELRAVALLPHPSWPRPRVHQACATHGATWAIDDEGELVECIPSAGVQAQSHDVVDVTFSSGSSGAPKAIAHTRAGHAASADAVTTAVEYGQGGAWALDLPLAHVGGLCILSRACRRGGAIVLPHNAAPAFLNPRATHASVVPTHLVRALNDEQWRHAFTNMNAILVGGASVSTSVAQTLLGSDFAANIMTSYGMTEMTSTAAIAARGDIGGPMHPLPHVSLRLATSSDQPIVDGDGADDSDASDEGEICLRGPSLSPSAPLDVDGWFHSADGGAFDRGGQLQVRGRIGRMFISGGENVSPERVESAMVAAGATAACVVDVEDPQWGHIGAVFIAGANLDTVVEKAARNLAPFERPKMVLHWPDAMAFDKPAYKSLRAIANEHRNRTTSD